MKYRSTNETQPLDFEFAGVQYYVEPGGFVEIDDYWAPWVIRRGLMLTPVLDELAEHEPEPEPEVKTYSKRKKKC